MLEIMNNLCSSYRHRIKYFSPHSDCSSHPVTFKTGSITVSTMSDTADTVICAPDDECSYHSKHVEQFTNINELYIVASC
jgi:hypothetical protein